MNILNQDKYIKAWNYASNVHNEQKVPGTELPYINHIGLVAMESMAAIPHCNQSISADLLVLCALLHDTIEDTGCTFTQIEEEFGTAVANGVQALSKDKTLPSKQMQMEDSLKRIKEQPKEIWMVKLSDRITNLQPPPSHWDQNKIKKYKNEANTILVALGEGSDFLAERLRFKINEYAQYEI